MTVFALADAPLSVSYPPGPGDAAFLDFVSQADGSAQYLVEIDSLRGGENRSGGLWTLTEGPLAAVAGGVAASVASVQLRYSDRHWMGSPTDADKPNVYYEGRLTGLLQIDRTLPVNSSQPRRVTRQIGEIEIANSDADLDTVSLNAIDGRQVRVLFGELMSAYANFRVVADVVGVAWERGDTSVKVLLRDRSYNLDRPLQTNLYAGTGSEEGAADIEGSPKPLAFGRVLNVTAVLIDSTNQIYQVHDGSIEAIDNVYDSGVALTPQSNLDIANYSALVSESVSAGNFATALSEGLFKLGTSPSGLVTADVRGDNTPTYVNTLHDIASRIVLDRAGLSPTLFNAGTFAGASLIAGESGIYISSAETPTTSDVVSVLMGASGSWWGGARDGKLRAGRLSDPAPRSPKLWLDQWDIVALELEPSPDPYWRQRVGYEKNWTIQTDGIAASVTSERRTFLANEYRFVSAFDNSVRARHTQAIDSPALPSLSANEVNAQALADSTLALHAIGRMILNVTIKREGYLVDLNDFVHLTWPRLGLNNGRMFAVVGIREDANEDLYVLRLWG